MLSVKRLSHPCNTKLEPQSHFFLLFVFRTIATYIFLDTGTWAYFQSVFFLLIRLYIGRFSKLCLSSVLIHNAISNSACYSHWNVLTKQPKPFKMQKKKPILLFVDRYTIFGCVFLLRLLMSALKMGNRPSSMDRRGQWKKRSTKKERNKCSNEPWWQGKWSLKQNRNI